MRSIAKPLCLLLVGLVFALSLANSTAQAKATADEILARVIERYGHLRTYRDMEEIESVVMSRPVRGRVRTLFVAPGSIMVHIKANAGFSKVYVAHDGAVRSWTPTKGWQDLSNRGQLLSSVKGTTVMLGRATHWITSLLFPDEGQGAGLKSVSDVRRLEDDQVSGVACFRLRGKLRGGEEITIWVAMSELSIRRIELRDPTETATIEYQAELNPQIAADEVLREAERATRQ